MKKSNEEEKILSDLEGSGYPLEINATSILESNGWNVINQEGYFDLESNKWRTIDIIATKNIALPSLSAYERLHISLIIKCKKSDKPWVFWVRGKEGMWTFKPIASAGLIKLESKPRLHPLHYEKLAENFHYYFSEFNKVGIIGVEAFKEGEGGNIFEAKNQVIKALMYEREQTTYFLIAQEAKEKTVNSLILFYPVIIFDGHMYELEYKGDKLTLTRSYYIQYLTSSIQHLRSLPTGYPISENFVIDVVEIAFLSKYLKVLDEETKKLSQKISTLKNPSQVSE